MTWSGEVVHIMRKDVRELRWVVGGYLFVLAIATMNALGWLSTQHSFDGSMFLVVITGMFLLASLVQADSPTRPDAFWATHPHRPSAVMCAKLASAVVVVVAPALAGQYAAISVLAVDGSSAARILAASAAVYGAWLLLTLVIAAITPDIRSFVIVLIATPIALIVATNLFFPGQPTLSATTRTGFGVAGLVGALVFVAVLYHTRDTRRRTWIAGFAVVACIAFAALFATTVTAMASAGIGSSPAQVAHAAAIHFEMGPLTRAPDGNAIFYVRVVVDSAPAGQRIAFTPTVATFDVIGGKPIRARINYGEMLLVAPDILLGGGMRVSSGNPVPGVNMFGLQLPMDQPRLRSEDVSGVTIEGNVRATAATMIGTLRVERGAVLVRPGIRVEVAAVHNTPEPQISLYVRSISDDGATTISLLAGRNTFDAVLVDESRRTAQRLDPRGSSGMIGAMVLPAAGVSNENIQFGMTPSSSVQTVPTPDIASRSVDGATAYPPEKNVDAAWSHAHRLTLLKWVNAGNYHVTSRARATLASDSIGSASPSVTPTRAPIR